MNKLSPMTLVKNNYQNLSKKESTIIDYLLEHPETVLSMTISQLASELSVAASTIVRMSKNLGYSGFAALKLDLAKYSKSELNVLLPIVDTQDTTATVFQKVFTSSIQTLQDTLQLSQTTDLETAVTLLHQANSIQFYGVGTSAPLAMDAYYRFMRIGYNTFYSIDSQIMRISASRLAPTDVAIAISHCGKTIDTVETLRIAKEKGAKTIAITSNNNSPIAQYADIILVAYSDEVRYPIEAVSSRLAHLAILDALCVALSLKSPEQTASCVESMNESFQKLRIHK